MVYRFISARIPQVIRHRFAIKLITEIIGKRSPSARMYPILSNCKHEFTVSNTRIAIINPTIILSLSSG
jgi:hypothetical protein